MSKVSTFIRCVGESPPVYGARKAHCTVPPSYMGRCCLRYQLYGRTWRAGFNTYSQALTAATMAIFSMEKNFQQVTIEAWVEPGLCELFSSARQWLIHQSKVYENDESAVTA